MLNNIFLYEIILKAILVIAPVLFLSLLFFSAPYGRYARRGFGPSMPNRWGWVMMEIPAVIIMFLFLLNETQSGISYIFLFLWEIHYLHRTFIFPFRLHSVSKPMPIIVPVMGFIFNMGNTYINGISLTIIHKYPTFWLIDPRFIIGTLLFITGFFINLQSDNVLLHLRKPGETTYKIPHGGLYSYISCPNYLGEIMEWLGWAIATWSLAGFAFFVWTFANLLPRALLHHRWYCETFSDYPKNRRALVPWIL